MTYIQYAPLLYWAWLFTTISVLLWRDELPEWRCFFSFLLTLTRCVPLLFMRPARMYAKRSCKMMTTNRLDGVILASLNHRILLLMQNKP